MKTPLNVKMLWVKISGFIFSIFYPEKCMICNKYGLLLCSKCATLIKMIKTPLCPICGRISKEFRVCTKCRKDFKYIYAVIPSCHYGDGPIKDLIYNFKYDGVIGLSELFAELIYQNIKALPVRNTLVVPVPLHISKLNTRGFNQSEEIAKILAKRLDIQISLCLERVKKTKNQAQLSRKERLNSQTGAFAIKGQCRLDNLTILLIDDVSTTCSTLNECAKVLRSVGARKVIGCVIARNI